MLTVSWKIWYVIAIQSLLSKLTPLFHQTAQSAIPIPPGVASDPFIAGYEGEDAPQELLRTYITARSRWGLPQGLVIQSEQPEVYPHIVITPPAYTSFESYCLCGHCSYDKPSLPPQSACYLSVPPRRDEGIIKATYLWRDDEAECNPVLREAPGESSSSDRTDLFGQPIRVFNLSLFQQTVSIIERRSRPGAYIIGTG